MTIQISRARKVSGVLAAVLLPVAALAEEPKQLQLADYVPFCLALWADAPDIQAKASALGLQSPSGPSQVHLAIGQSTLQFYKSAQGDQTVMANITKFTDGKDSSCDVNMPVRANRTDLATMAQALHLDGQIMELGPTIIARWKVPNRRPPVLLKVIATKSAVSMVMQQYDAGGQR
jgi:hypothetical protein